MSLAVVTCLYVMHCGQESLLKIAAIVFYFKSKVAAGWRVQKKHRPDYLKTALLLASMMENRFENQTLFCLFFYTRNVVVAK